MKGKFIVFEGLTCSGKTTQAEMLVKYFNQHGQKSILDNEPTENLWGRVIRSIISNPNNKLTEIERQILFIADRREDLIKTIRPSLENGINVILDRYELTTFAHGLANGLTFKELSKAQHKILGRAYKKPDVTIFLDTKPETAIARLAKSRKEKDMYEILPQSRKIYSNYKRFIKNFPGFGKIIVINGERSINQIFKQLIDALSNL